MGSVPVRWGSAVQGTFAGEGSNPAGHVTLLAITATLRAKQQGAYGREAQCPGLLHQLSRRPGG